MTCIGIRHTYGDENHRTEVLRGVDLEIPRGAPTVLAGPSGSGKTTLLSVAGCLLRATSGRLLIGGREIPREGDALQRARREKIGFVFQHAQLLPFLTVRENLEVVGMNMALTAGERTGRIRNLLDRLGMADHADRKAAVLSGGQRQRVSVARALLGRPEIILADEPTAALEWSIGKVVISLLTEACRDGGCGLLVVTHDQRLLTEFDQVLEMREGKVISQTAA